MIDPLKGEIGKMKEEISKLHKGKEVGCWKDDGFKRISKGFFIACHRGTVFVLYSLDELKGRLGSVKDFTYCEKISIFNLVLSGGKDNVSHMFGGPITHDFRKKECSSFYPDGKSQGSLSDGQGIPSDAEIASSSRECGLRRDEVFMRIVMLERPSGKEREVVLNVFPPNRCFGDGGNISENDRIEKVFYFHARCFHGQVADSPFVKVGIICKKINKPECIKEELSPTAMIECARSSALHKSRHGTSVFTEVMFANPIVLKQSSNAMEHEPSRSVPAIDLAVTHTIRADDKTPSVVGSKLLQGAPARKFVSSRTSKYELAMSPLATRSISASNRARSLDALDEKSQDSSTDDRARSLDALDEKSQGASTGISIHGNLVSSKLSGASVSNPDVSKLSKGFYVF